MPAWLTPSSLKAQLYLLHGLPARPEEAMTELNRVFMSCADFHLLPVGHVEGMEEEGKRPFTLHLARLL